MIFRYKKSKNLVVVVLSIFTLNPLKWIVAGIVLLFSEFYGFGIGLIAVTLLSFPLENQISVQIMHEKMQLIDDQFDDFVQRMEKIRNNPVNSKISESFISNEITNKEAANILLTPSITHEPDLDTLDPFVKKYEPLLNNMMKSSVEEFPGWVQYKKAIDDMFFVNFSSISYYMDNEVFRNKDSKRREFEERVKTATTYAASCSWMIGCEFAQNDNELKIRLQAKSSIRIGDIPNSALELINVAAYFPYWIFGQVFLEYYRSNYTSHAYQKDVHLSDTYNGLIRGLIMCFHEGVKSNIYK